MRRNLMGRIRKFIDKIRIGILHARFHKNLRYAEFARIDKDIVAFKKYVYQAEDAWKQIVQINEKNKL